MRARPPLLLVIVALGVFTFATRYATGLAVGSAVTLALLATLASALVVNPAAGSPSPRELPWAWASLFGALVLLMSALTFLVAPDADWWLGPGAGGLGTSLVFVAVYVLWLAPVRAIQKLRARAQDPAHREAAASELVASFRGPAPTGAIARKRRALRALAATGALMDSMCFDHAAQVIGAVDPASVGGELRAALLSTRASIAIHQGARDAAFAALAEAARYAVSRPLQDLLLINDALLESQDGRGDEALERLGRCGPPATPAHARALLVARAHALAAKGDTAAAERVVAEVVATAPEALERVAHLPGPAQSLFGAAAAARKPLAPGAPHRK